MTIFYVKDHRSLVIIVTESFSVSNNTSDNLIIHISTFTRSIIKRGSLNVKTEGIFWEKINDNVHIQKYKRSNDIVFELAIWGDIQNTHKRK